MIASPSQIRSFGVSKSLIGVSGAHLLGLWLATDPPLEALYVRCCGITAAGLRVLLIGVRRCKALRFIRSAEDKSEIT
eukprot:m.133590 g.133590  ORF g.133590 m.133590 type:complete len:78 (+) comp9506_c0_seq3:2395-2628(+)